MGPIMQVRDVMTRKVISVTLGDSIVAAARLMLQNRISGLPVVDAGGSLVGIFSRSSGKRTALIDLHQHADIGKVG
jgi:CBS domain-containing protein